MAKGKGLNFKISLKGLFIGLLASIMVVMGIFLFMSIASGRLSFEASPYPRQDRAILVLLSWIFISVSFLVIAPNRHGLLPSLGMFLSLYLGFAVSTGSVYVFDSSAFMEIATAMKIMIAPIFFCVVLTVLLYNAVSGQEFFRSVIFGGVSIGVLVAGAFMGII